MLQGLVGTYWSPECLPILHILERHLKCSVGGPNCFCALQSDGEGELPSHRVGRPIHPPDYGRGGNQHIVEANQGETTGQIEAA